MPKAKKKVKRPSAKKTKKVVRRKVTAKKAAVDKKPSYRPVSVPNLEVEKYEPHIRIDEGVADLVRGSTKYAFVGTGQCGGRIAKSFYDLGYRKVLAVNTAHHDLDLLDLPKNQKYLMDIGEKGAGKDMSKGKQAAQQYEQEILHLMQKIFAEDVEHVIICLGGGGGSGSGSAVHLAEIARKYIRSIGKEEANKHVGAIVTLPTIGEASSQLVAQNAYSIVTELGEMASRNEISPLIIIDNEKIAKMYPGLTVKAFWPTINNTVAGLFDIFNRISALSSQYTSFDPTDYHNIVEIGGCTIMGLTQVKEFKDKFALSQALKRDLEKTLLANGFDLSTAKAAGCIVIAGAKLMASVKGLQENINYGFDVIAEIAHKATIYRGIYEDKKDTLRVYTIISGLGMPDRRLRELKG